METGLKVKNANSYNNLLCEHLDHLAQMLLPTRLVALLDRLDVPWDCSRHEWQLLQTEDPPEASPALQAR